MSGAALFQHPCNAAVHRSASANIVGHEGGRAVLRSLSPTINSPSEEVPLATSSFARAAGPLGNACFWPAGPGSHKKSALAPVHRVSSVPRLRSRDRSAPTPPLVLTNGSPGSASGPGGSPVQTLTPPQRLQSEPSSSRQRAATPLPSGYWAQMSTQPRSGPTPVVSPPEAQSTPVVSPSDLVQEVQILLKTFMESERQELHGLFVRERESLRVELSSLRQDCLDLLKSHSDSQRSELSLVGQECLEVIRKDRDLHRSQLLGIHSEVQQTLTRMEQLETRMENEQSMTSQLHGPLPTCAELPEELSARLDELIGLVIDARKDSEAVSDCVAQLSQQVAEHDRKLELHGSFFLAREGESSLSKLLRSASAGEHSPRLSRGSGCNGVGQGGMSGTERSGGYSNSRSPGNQSPSLSAAESACRDLQDVLQRSGTSQMRSPNSRYSGRSGR